MSFPLRRPFLYCARSTLAAIAGATQSTPSLRYLIQALPSARVLGGRHAHTGPLLHPPQLSILKNASDNAKAREWIDQFQLNDIPQDIVQLSFSRSSGPGGQNVNKVNTKVTLRCPLSSDWIPLWAHDYLKKSPFYVSSTKCIQITSTVHRSQAQNIDDCLRKLRRLVHAAASDPIQAEPSEEQKERVRGLQRKENAKRKLDKHKRSDIKKSRSSKNWD
ncbi:RF-1 domain-containing protein [Fomitopsis betulina]|nr:RF-1 domain-containing protein [Fomitopsis betulina]